MKLQKTSLAILKSCLLAVCVLAVSFSFSSCSKDDDNGDDVSGTERIKITISSSDTFSKDTGGDLSVHFASFDSGGTKSQTWKINGEESGAETLHTLSNDDFEGGKSYTLESQANYLTASVSIGAFSINRAYTLKYKIEQGSKVIAEEEVEITKDRDVFTKSYQFPQ